jgi:hypothetical protein
MMDNNTAVRADARENDRGQRIDQLGGGRHRQVVTNLEQHGPGHYRTTEPVPVWGTWKTLLRLHDGETLAAVPIYLAGDPGIGAKEVPAEARRRRRRRAGHGGGGVVGGHIGEGASPPSHAPAGEHGEAERERLGPRMQRGAAKLFVAGVQPATTTITLTHRMSQWLLDCSSR